MKRDKNNTLDSGNDGGLQISSQNINHISMEFSLSVIFRRFRQSPHKTTLVRTARIISRRGFRLVVGNALENNGFLNGSFRVNLTLRCPDTSIINKYGSTIDDIIVKDKIYKRGLPHRIYTRYFFFYLGLGIAITLLMVWLSVFWWRNPSTCAAALCVRVVRISITEG